jgi:hypothetical protein
MVQVIRRQLLAGLSSLLLTSEPLCRAVASTARSGNNGRDFDDSDYTLGCILAKRAGLAFVRGNGDQPATSIDFWTTRVSEIEFEEFPPNIGRVVVWDDVFSCRHLANRVQDIYAALGRYYGFDCAMGSDSFAFHLEGFSDVGSVIANLLLDSACVRVSPRVAIVDIESSGITRLRWSDFLPHLRAHYDFIIRFAHFAGQGPSHWGTLFGEERDYHSSIRTSLTHCDLSFFTSDGLLGFEDALESGVRGTYLHALLHELTCALSSVEFLNKVTGMAGVSSFGMGASPSQASPQDGFTSSARQRRIILQEFGIAGLSLPLVHPAEDENRWPLLAQGLALWPLRPSHVA